MKTINEQTNWWVRVTEENKETLDKWFKSSSHLKGKVGVYLNYQSIYCKGTISENTPAKDKDGSWDFGNEISFEEFKRYILKEYTIPENWCIKITNSNSSYLNEKRVHGCTNFGFLNHYLNYGITDFWNWSTDFPKGCIEITLNDFKKYVILEPIAKVYPTSLEKVKFKSEPDKCVGKRPSNIIMDYDIGNTARLVKEELDRQRKLMYNNVGIKDSLASKMDTHQALVDVLQEEVDKRAAQRAINKAIRFGEAYGMKEGMVKDIFIAHLNLAEKLVYMIILLKVIMNQLKSKMFLFGTGGETDNKHYEEVFEKPFKWAELPDYMLKQNTMYNIMSEDLKDTFEIMKSQKLQYPLTSKESYPSDIIYVKRIKTFLK